MISHQQHFFRAFLRNAGHVGSVTPSSPELARIMVDWLDWDSIDHVVEFGPGTGVFTEAISNRAGHDTKIIAIERDPHLAEITRKRCPDVSVHVACVSDVPGICREAGIDSVDVIISGLPWASFPESLQDEYLDAMFEILPPGGRFTTFAYWQGLLLPAGLRFRKNLQEHFSTVEISPTAWSNFPPAFAYRCIR